MNRSGNSGTVASRRNAFAHTPWCRWITSTGGTLPFFSRRFGLKPTIHPSSVGWGIRYLLVSMTF